MRPTVSFHHVGKDETPTMAINLIRVGRQRNRVFILLTMIHVFCVDKDNVDGMEVLIRAKNYCNHLYGYGNWTKGELKYVCELILDNLEQLRCMPPKREMTRKEFENKLDRAGFKMEINGETVVDAS